jgi:hypothetical protein
MNINETFSGSFLKAADLKGAQPTVTIAEIRMEKMGEDTKPAIYFVGKEKGVVLNKTNATNIAAAYGPETNNWLGKKVILFSAWVDFQGKSVEAIRIRPAPQQQQQAPQYQTEARTAVMPVQTAQPQHAPQFESGDDFRDDIPF